MVFDEMINRGVRLNTLGFGVFVWWTCKKRELSEILSLIDDVRKLVKRIAGSFPEDSGMLFRGLQNLCVEARQVMER
ncbi:hypothetical protein ACS0TY_030654 [Phlomoides rotata]